MEDEVVRRRGWLSRERFLDLLGATNLIPGPNSTEMAIHVGHQRAGWRGLVVAGVSFILPAFLIVLACAWAYARHGTLPAAEGLLRGVKPVIIAIVLQALWGLGRTATRTRLLAALGFFSFAAAAAGVHELAVIFGAGLLAALVAWARSARASRVHGFGLVPLGAAAALASSLAAAPFSLSSLFLVFLKIGSVLFGSVGSGLGDGRDLPPRLRLRGPERPARPEDPALAGGRGLPRRGERRLDRPRGPRHRAARPGGDRGRLDGRDRGRRGAAPAPLPREPGLAGPRRRAQRPRPAPLAVQGEATTRPASGQTRRKCRGFRVRSRSAPALCAARAMRAS
jgi:chromate transport protein ChrA